MDISKKQIEYTERINFFKEQQRSPLARWNLKIFTSYGKVYVI